MDKSARRVLETHVADNPVFVFYHEDGQVEVISSYTYLSAVEDDVKAATELWLICIEEWAKDFVAGEISANELRRYHMPLTTKTEYYLRWIMYCVLRWIWRQPYRTERRPWQELAAH